ncbi:MAG: septum formation initiator family protein [Pyrinomonadaceae bacterium]|nr:septum formation initiator family protein [Pyrinomonadaceae bacterium]
MTRRNMRGRRIRRNDLARVSRPKRRLMPRWVPVAASLTLVLTITATINLRAFRELQTEQQQHQELNQRVQQMTDENLGLQEEIYYLKNDPDTIEREAKRYGLVRPQKKLQRVSRAGELDKAEESTSRQTPTNK